MGYIMVKIKFLKEEDSKRDLKDHTLSDRTICDHHRISGRLYPKHYERTGSCMYRICDPAVFYYCLSHGSWEKMFHLNTVEYTSAYYSNSGNLIVPLVTYILGKEWVIYGCVFMSVQLFFIWTHCKCKISGETEISLKKILLNINMISVFAGVFLFFTKIRFPEIIGNTLSSVGSMIGPLSMIVTGMLIAGVDLKKVLQTKESTWSHSSD